jgi:site-specific recombinase XerD
MPNTLIQAPSDLAVNIQSFRLSLRAANKSPRTVQTYLESARIFSDFLRANGMPLEVRNIRREHIESFIEDQLARWKPATANARYRGLQAFFKYLSEDEGELKTSPMAKTKPPQVPETVVPIIAVEDIVKLLKATAGTSFEQRRDHAIIRTFISTGARRQEIAELRYTPKEPETNDVDLDMGFLRVRGKGGRDRLVALDDKTALAINRYLKARASHQDAAKDWLWLGRRGHFGSDGVRQMLERRATEAGIGHIHAHQFRHTAAHHWLSQGGNEGDLQRLMGWRSPEMLRRYGASAASERALAAARKIGLGHRV